MMRLVFLLCLCYANAATLPKSRFPTALVVRDSKTALAAIPRQDNPLSGALTGLFAPPFIVAVGMTALAHTFERFVTDVVKSTSRRGLRRRRKKKKPNNQEPIKPFPPLQVARPPPPPPPPAPPPASAPDSAPVPVSAPAPEAPPVVTDGQDASPVGRMKWFLGKLLHLLLQQNL